MLLGVLVLAPVLLYLLVSTWLESAGGRQALERELARRAGMQVRLLGKFDIRLLPALEVGGTELVVGGPTPDGEMVRSREFAVAIALKPLLDRELQVESIRLAGVTLWLDRVPPATVRPSGEPGEPVRLPAVDKLKISQLEIVSPAEAGPGFRVDELTIEGFAEGRDSTIRVKMPGYGQVDGQLRWESGASMLDLEGRWSGVLSGDLQFGVEADFAAATGHLEARWPVQPNSGTDVVTLSTGVAVREDTVDLQALKATAGAQSVRGVGCVLLGPPATLRLDLAADELDLDSLPRLPSGLAASSADGAAPNGLRIDARLKVGLLRAAGAVAHDAELSVGGKPDCSLQD